MRKKRQMEKKSDLAICHDRREKRVRVCDVTDLKSLFIANEITGDGMEVWERRGLPVSRDSILARACRMARSNKR